jgi:hypothetical protein
MIQELRNRDAICVWDSTGGIAQPVLQGVIQKQLSFVNETQDSNRREGFVYTGHVESMVNPYWRMVFQVGIAHGCGVNLSISFLNKHRNPGKAMFNAFLEKSP